MLQKRGVSCPDIILANLAVESHGQHGLDACMHFCIRRRWGQLEGCCALTTVQLSGASIQAMQCVSRCLCGSQNCHGFLGGHIGVEDDFWQDADGQYYLVSLLWLDPVT